ncbi:MAG: hypothetical protein ACK48M_06345, partial [Planctomycetia bacterium]
PVGRRCARIATRRRDDAGRNEARFDARCHCGRGNRRSGNSGCAHDSGSPGHANTPSRTG